MELQFHLFFFISCIVLAVTSVVHSCSPSDHAALMTFKSALTEPYLGIFNSWTGSACCTNWYGVTCDPTTNRVTDLLLRGESEDPILQKTGRSGYMTGSISPSLCNLDQLTTLVLADWKSISGEIPACIPSSLPRLRILDLVGNSISGRIPSDIGKLNRLTVLNVADNQISGEIPASIVDLNNLKHLDLSNNQISGQIPADIGKLSMTSRLLLGRNKIAGTIPSSISNIRRLADLDLSYNQISGSIPYSLGKMPVLSTLNLDNNRISGPLPGSLLSSGLNILTLSRNLVDGPIPDVFHRNTYFTALDLSYNNLKGSVPVSMSSARYIGHVDLSHNHLCGPMPVSSTFDHLEASSFANNDCRQ